MLLPPFYLFYYIISKGRLFIINTQKIDFVQSLLQGFYCPPHIIGPIDYQLKLVEFSSSVAYRKASIK